jgi:hypothetical protein
MFSKLFEARLQYIIGLMQLIITAFMVAYSIRGAKLLHLAKFIIFVPMRYIQYKQRGWHYYLTEFCYYASLMFNLFLLQDLLFDGILNHYFISVYCMTSGPILFAIFLNGEKLYLHSHSHLASLYLHLTPALMTWMMRWHNNTTDFVALYPPHFDMKSILETCSIFVSQCLYIYIPWSLLYFVYMFIIKRKKIYDTNKLTMFRQYVEGNNNSLGKKINKLDNYLLKAIIYMMIHFTSNILLATLAVLLFHSFYLNTFVIISAFIFSSWKGSYKLMSLLVESETKNKITKSHSASNIQPTNTDKKQ